MAFVRKMHWFNIDVETILHIIRILTIYILIVYSKRITTEVQQKRWSVAFTKVSVLYKKEGGIINKPTLITVLQ